MNRISRRSRLRNMYCMIVGARKVSLKFMGQTIRKDKLGTLVRGVNCLLQAVFLLQGRFKDQYSSLMIWAASSQESVPGEYGDSGVQGHM